VLCTSTASARELWTRDDGSAVLEGRAFYKTLGEWLRLPEGLVQGTQALASLVPGTPSLPRDAALSAHTVRAWGRLVWGGRLELQAGWQVSMLAASEAGLTGGGLVLPQSGTVQAASRRLVDFDPVLLSEGGLQATHNLDLLAIRANLPFGDLTVGRQVLSWGTGRLWNPTDLLSPFSPTDIDREVRRGVDAVRLSVPLGDTSGVDLLWLPQRNAADQGGVLRARTNLAGFDFSLSAAKYVRDAVLGADFAGDLGPAGIHGEAAVTWPLRGLDSGSPGVGALFVRAVAGAEWKPTDKWILLAEYYFNGWGAERPEGYLATMRSDRVVRGEVFGAGRHYAGVVAAYAATELLSIQAVVIGNLVDPSAVAMPAIEYWLEQNVIAWAGAFLPFGAGADPSALRSLGLADVFTQSPAFQSAVSSLGIRSEYGVSPAGVFAQVGIYF